VVDYILSPEVWTEHFREIRSYGWDLNYEMENWRSERLFPPNCSPGNSSRSRRAKVEINQAADKERISVECCLTHLRFPLLSELTLAQARRQRFQQNRNILRTPGTDFGVSLLPFT
jgi:hypothetical protein